MREVVVEEDVEKDVGGRPFLSVAQVLFLLQTAWTSRISDLSHRTDLRTGLFLSHTFPLNLELEHGYYYALLLDKHPLEPMHYGPSPTPVDA